MNHVEAMQKQMKAIIAGKQEKGLLATFLAQMEEDNPRNNISEVDFSPEVKKIIVPTSLNKLQAAEELTRQWEDDQSIISVSREFESAHWKDVLVAFRRVATEEFGWVQGIEERTMFGKNPPQEIEIVVDIKDGKKITETCFYGAVKVSTWDNAILKTRSAGRDTILLTCEGKKMYGTDIKGFFDKIENHIKNNSIFKGKAVISTRKINPVSGGYSVDFEVFENDVSDKIFLNKETETLISEFIEPDLTLPGKRTYLFTGDYGNAKTETAMRVGKTAMDAGLTFFYCKQGQGYTDLLEKAVAYQPCLIFMEDIDEISAGETRDSSMNELLNTVDGIETKNKSITTVFTTNHEERINRAMRRPGRIDMIVPFSAPDAMATEKILKSYLWNLEGGTSLDYGKATKAILALPISSGAIVAEIGKRAEGLARRKGEINFAIIEIVLISIKPQVDLMIAELESVDSHLDEALSVIGSALSDY